MGTPTRDELVAMSSGERQETPTTPYWRGLMRIRRDELKITQVQLAAKIGVSQPAISGIEAGTMAQSKSVRAICIALGMPMPVIVVNNEYDERWCNAGRRLLKDQRDFFMAQLAAFESLGETGDE